MVADCKLLKRTVPVIGKTMAQEIKALCSVDAESILSRTDAATLQAFSWKQLLNELHKTAPITTTLLSNSLTCLRSSKSKKGPRRANNDATVGLCCGLLVRARNQILSNSSFLFSCMVVMLEIIVHMTLLCAGVLTASEALCWARTFDEKVKSWKQDIESGKNQVRITIHVYIAHN